MVEGVVSADSLTLREAIARWGGAGRDVAVRLIDGGAMIEQCDDHTDLAALEHDGATSVTGGGPAVWPSLVASDVVPSRLDTTRGVVRLTDATNLDWTALGSDMAFDRIEQAVHRSVENGRSVVRPTG
ncbi:MAG: hypothetical protein AAGF73_11085 [Actinomycetota bacterium]